MIAVLLAVSLILAILLVLAFLGMCRVAARGDRRTEAAVARVRVERRQGGYHPFDR